MVTSALHALKHRLKPWLLAIWKRLPFWLQGRIEWLLQPKFMVGAVAVVFDCSERVLLFRHTYRTEYPWGFPGGWLKAGEDPTEAVEREVFEESGYQVRARYPLVIGGDRDLRRLDLIFLCELIEGEFRSSAEVSEAEFVALADLPGRVEPFHVQVARYAMEMRARIEGEPASRMPQPPDDRRPALTDAGPYDRRD